MAGNNSNPQAQNSAQWERVAVRNLDSPRTYQQLRDQVESILQ